MTISITEPQAASPRFKSLAPLYWGLLFTTALVAIIVGSILWVSALNQADNAWVNHTLALRGQLRDTLVLIQKAESSQRGYLLTGRDAYLTPFATAIKQLPGAIDHADRLIADNSAQAPMMQSVGRLITAKVQELQSTVDTYKAGHRDMALALVNTDKGLNLMEDIQATLARMEAEDGRELAARQQKAATSATLLQIAAATAFLLICAVGLLIGYFTQRSFSELTAANQEIAESNLKLRQEVERREMVESQLRQAQKMEAIGQLTGGIAHDFNNMLGVIGGSLDLMRRAIKRGNFGIERLIESALQAVERSAALTKRLLAFGRQQPLAPEPVDANKMIANMSDLLRSTLGEQIRIETVSAGGLWMTHADAHQLENAVLNIAINARDAMPDGGKLTIETGNTYLDEAYCQQNEDIEPGQFVLIALTDTGAGMPSEIVARVFDPFFTTKPPGRGTGLGLSQVYGFIKQSRGHIKVYSEIGNGTTVKIYLPRLLSAAQPAKPVSSAQIQRGGSDERVLVVEDDFLMRQMSCEALRDLGYTVVDCDSAAAALKILEETLAINLLFTDVVMPDMNGKKLADQVSQRWPDVKVLYTTGYTRNAVVHSGVLDPGVNFISKPFTLEQLAAKVRSVLDS